MPGKAAGRAAVELPWLCPNTDSLIALADAPATVHGLSAADPALAVFLLRFAGAAPESDPFGFAPGAFLSPFLPETAAAYLAATKAGVLPGASHALSQVRAVAADAARIAGGLADTTRRVASEAAASVARLAPLGWYAVAAVDPFAVGDPIHDPHFPESPSGVQEQVWGLDHAAIARRLAARWKLPNWVATTVGCLTLPLRVGGHLASHRDLFAVVQLAVSEAERRETFLGLTHGSDRAELLEYLGLNEDAVAEIAGRTPVAAEPAAGSGLDPDPHRVPLVRNLLRMAAESRRRNGPGLVARLEERVDELHRVACVIGDEGGERLRDAKLAALAELAAGAGHEINNPLAVISGNAQRLLRTEPDAERGDALQVIVRQTGRIAGILRDLMQFARPPRPEVREFAVADLLGAVRDELTPSAAERAVKLEFEGAPTVRLDGDPKQLRHALAAVVRNAVEAVPVGGRVRVWCSVDDDLPDVTITVEDSGPGLTPEAVEHAFDPFFCGRSAGRGRGLGLPTAWQLVRQNGGDLRYQPSRDNTTRFAFTLRRAAGCGVLSLRSA